MARMFPQSLDGWSPTPGEERVFALLKRVLAPDADHWAWYEPTISARRGKSPEPDFVLLGPGYGALVLEVKDWSLGAIRQADAASVLLREEDGREVRHTHPLKQARKAAYALKERFEAIPGLTGSGRHQGKSVVPVNCGVAYPNLARRDLVNLREKGLALFPDLALTREDLERTDEEGLRRLLAGLERMARVRFPFTLTPAVRDAVRAAIQPQLRFSDLREDLPGALPGETTVTGAVPEAPGKGGAPAAPATARLGPELGRVTRAPLPELTAFWLDRKQERIARSLASPRNVIYGPAGSGKTVFLVARAQYWLDRMPGARVLFTCYNSSLASHLRNVFALKGSVVDGERLTVLHYHDLCAGILGRSDIHERNPEFYAALEPRLLQDLARRDDIPVYDCILVDEGQDFTRRMLEVLVRLSAGGGEITLVCDPAQDIYGRWSVDNLAPLGRPDPERLVDCYRNTAPIFALALAVLPEETRTAMGLERLEMTRPEDLARTGPPPALTPLEGLDDLVTLVAGAAARFDRDGIPLSQLAVLYPGHEAIPNFAGRLRHSRWRAAADPRFRALDPEDDPAAPEPGRGTLAAGGDREDAAAPGRPHFAEALEQELLSRGIPAEWVARDFASKAAYDISRPRLTLSTIHSAKGMDFETVILLGADSLSTRPGADARRSAALLFTGITRARERLVLPYFLDRNWVPLLRERIGDVEAPA